MKKVLFINGQSQEIADIVSGMAPEGGGFEFACLPSSLGDKAKIQAMAGVEYLLLHPATLSATVLAQASSVKLVQLLSAGYDQVDIRAAAAAGIPVATNGGANAWAVAEHAVALMLALYKKLLACDASVRAGGWRRPVNGFNTFELAGKTVGIVGAGNIGRKVAARVKPFETHILYHDQNRVAELEERCAARKVQLDELLRTADIITLHAPLLESTRGMIGGEQLAAMKKTAILINTSRAELIDEPALAAALAERRIAGAGLDVFRKEPIPADSPFLGLDNVILTPHSAGHSYEGWFRRAENAWRNIVKVASGQQPDHVVRAP